MGPRSKGKDSSFPLKENPEFCIECAGSISREGTDCLHGVAASPSPPLILLRWVKCETSFVCVLG
jgi:hypothetical protein